MVMGGGGWGKLSVSFMETEDYCNIVSSWVWRAVCDSVSFMHAGQSFQGGPGVMSGCPQRRP